MIGSVPRKNAKAQRNWPRGRERNRLWERWNEFHRATLPVENPIAESFHSRRRSSLAWICKSLAVSDERLGGLESDKFLWFEK